MMFLITVSLNFCHCSFIQSNLYHFFTTHALHLVPRVILILCTMILVVPSTLYHILYS